MPKRIDSTRDGGQRGEHGCVQLDLVVGHHKPGDRVGVGRPACGAKGERVVACAANQRIAAQFAVQNVGACVAGQGLGNARSGHVDRAGSGGVGGFQEFNIGGCVHHVADRCLHPVGGAVARHFGNRVGSVVDDIGIVAAIAGHRISSARTTGVQHVVAIVPGDRLAQGVPGQVDIGRATAGIGGQLLDV